MAKKVRERERETRVDKHKHINTFAHHTHWGERRNVAQEKIKG